MPFSWDIRLSKRAKRPRITINSYGKVELVWPIKMSQRHVSSMLEQHQGWVLKQLGKVKAVKPQTKFPPQSIYLQSIDQTWQVFYQQTDSARISLLEKGDSLHLSGDIHNHEAIRKSLCRWVKKQGQQHLTYWLADVAEGMGLTYKSLAIRLQKKRWGSCSASKRINLNAALLFLPPTLVEHVLVHELTHLNHLNHSASFWAGVEKHDKDYKQNRRMLRKHAADVPMWLTEPFGDIVSNEDI
ncbi:MAG: SprT family zinc-dependent metalloprotease [Ghiorsea sp.]